MLIKVIPQSVELMYPELIPDALSRIELCARTSHASEGLQTSDSWKKFIPAVVINHGDWSVVEHVSATVRFVCDRGTSHELVRHRLASYTQSSTRFVNFNKKSLIEFIYPDVNVPLCQSCFDELNSLHTCNYNPTWKESISNSVLRYNILLADGWPPQLARSVLPNALATTVVVTMNLRSWRQVLLARTTKEAHPQIKTLMLYVLNDFQKLVPFLFDDIIPGEMQRIAFSKPR